MGNLGRFLRNLIAQSTLIGGLISFVFLTAIAVSTSTDASIVNDGFYSGLMGILSIMAGFVAAFYFFAASRGNVFLTNIQNSNSFAELLWLTRHGLLASIVGTVFSFWASLVDLEVHWDPRQTSALALIALAANCYAGGTIWRCARIFQKLVEAPKT